MAACSNSLAVERWRSGRGKLSVGLHQLLKCGGLSVVGCPLWVSCRATLTVGLYHLHHCGGLSTVDCSLCTSCRATLAVGYTICFIAVGCAWLTARCARCAHRVVEGWLPGYTSCFNAVGCARRPTASRNVDGLHRGTLADCIAERWLTASRNVGCRAIPVASLRWVARG